MEIVARHVGASLQSDRAGLALVVASVIAFVGALFAFWMILVHWLLATAAFIVLARVPRRRRAAAVGLATLVVALAFALPLAGVTIGGVGGASGSEHGDSAAALAASLAGVVALAAFAAIAESGWPRMVGAAAVLAGAALVAGMFVPRASEALLGTAFVTCLAGASLAVSAHLARQAPWRAADPAPS